MSKAGVESSIGDEYQTLIGAFWAIQMLVDPEILKIEIESTSFSPNGLPFSVDDIVIHYRKGGLTCCQCKKNQPVFKAWTVKDLKEDLEKAWLQHNDTPCAEIIFYSRNDFGAVGRLADRARVMSDVQAFLRDIPKDIAEEFATLETICSVKDGHSTDRRGAIFSFFQKLSFETLPGQTLEQMLLSMLQRNVTHSQNALKIILHEIDGIARRSNLSQAHAEHHPNILTRNSLLRLLADNGHSLFPSKTEEELVTYFTQISSTGRFWPRTINGYSLPRKELQTLQNHIDARAKLVLLDGSPGAGKTCVLLELLESLETRSDTFPVFIQAREFTHPEIMKKLVDIIGNIARLSEYGHVVLLIDSLDVLSISQETQSLSTFLSLIYATKAIHNVTTITACRTFDIRYCKHPLLSAELNWTFPHV